MINNELLEEIIYISNKEKFIKEDLIIKIFIDLYKQLDPYTQNLFKELCFGEIDRKTETRGICYQEEGIIKLDLEQIFKEQNEYRYRSMLSKNLFILSILIHELQHLKELYKMTIDNFEGKVLKSSNDVEDDDLLDKLYECDPSEKIAFANSWNYILNSLNLYPNFKEDHFKEFAFVNNKYIDNLKIGYNYIKDKGHYNIPLINFLKKTNNVKLIKEVNTLKFIIDIKKNMSLEDKLKYGLNVSLNEIKNLNKQKIYKRIKG